MIDRSREPQLLGMLNTRSIASGLGFLLFVGGCGGDALDLGSSGTNGSTGTGTSQEPASVVLPDWSELTQCTATPDSPIVGKWSGYVEAADPEDTFTLDIRGASETAGVCGTLTFSRPYTDPSIPADYEFSPVTDPELGYPPEFGMIAAFTQPWPSFANTLLQGTLEGQRVRFVVATTEPWREWCSLQTPVAGVDGTYGCLAGKAPPVPVVRCAADGACTLTNPLSGGPQPVDEGKAALCGALLFHPRGTTGGSATCVCNASGCAARADQSYPLLDLIFDGSEADGTKEGQRVRLQRVDP